MSILAKYQILKEVDAYNIEISLLDKSQVVLASIDSHLESEFSMFKKTFKTNSVNPEASAEGEILDNKVITDHPLLSSHKTVIAITKERTRLSPSLRGRLEGRRDER